MSDIDKARPGRRQPSDTKPLPRFANPHLNPLSEELFRLLARELRAVVNFYVMGVGIYDENAHAIHLTSYGEPGVPFRFHNSRQKKPSRGGCSTINSR